MVDTGREMMVETGRDRTHTYDASLTWTGAGEAGTSDYRGYERSYSIRVAGKPELRGSAHPDFRGDPALHDPEDLFLAAVAACHMLSYLGLCARRGVRVLRYEDRASGILTLDADGGGRFTRIDLRPLVVVDEASDSARARELHAEAHEVCFIASSCSVPIACEPTVRTARSGEPADARCEREGA